MSNIRPDITIINAYVDGELDPAEAAHVADAIAADPHLASMVAKLHAMKTAVGDAFNTQEIIAVTHNQPFLARTGFWAVAACLLLAVVGGTMWYVFNQQNAKDTIAQALIQHDKWALKTNTPVLEVIITAALITPDLTPAGLRLAGIQKKVPLGKSFGTRYAYVGSRGCKLSLFVSDHDNAFEGLGSLVRPDALIVKWAVANRGFLLIARKMNRERFKVIARALETATARAVALDEPMRLALMQSRKPCLA